MNLDSLNKWLMFAANVGVVAGIVFLAFEVHQNNEFLEAQTTYNHMLARTAHADMILTNADIPSIIVKLKSGEALTEEEQYSYRYYVDHTFTSWEWDFNESLSGRLSLPVEALKAKLTNEPALIKDWYQRRSYYPTQGFAEFMDELINSLD